MEKRIITGQYRGDSNSDIIHMRAELTADLTTDPEYTLEVKNAGSKVFVYATSTCHEWDGTEWRLIG